MQVLLAIRLQILSVEHVCYQFIWHVSEVLGFQIQYVNFTFYARLINLVTVQLSFQQEAG